MVCFRFKYTTLTFFGCLLHSILLQNQNPILKTLQPPLKKWVWAGPFSLVAYSGNLLRFLFLGVLRYFSSPGIPPFIIKMKSHHDLS